ncbi:MAG: hypothetical protein ACOYM8_07930 [Caulobacterales bacterium]
MKMIRGALIAFAGLAATIAGPAAAAETDVASTCYAVSPRDAKGLGPAFTAGSKRAPRWSLAVYADEPVCARVGAPGRETSAECTARDPIVVVYKAAGHRTQTLRITTIGSHKVAADAQKLTCTYLD